MSLPHFTPFCATPYADGLFYPTVTVSTIAAATTATLTTAQVLGGLILQDVAASACTDTMPTAALLVAAMNGARIGSSFEFTIRNTCSSNYPITLAAGTGGTMASGNTNTVVQTASKKFLVVLTGVVSGSEAYTVYSLGTATF
jgi:hypothetical protein